MTVLFKSFIKTYLRLFLDSLFSLRDSLPGSLRGVTFDFEFPLGDSV